MSASTDQIAIPAAVIRRGTSEAFFRGDQLSADRKDWKEMLLAVRETFYPNKSVGLGQCRF